ncbi:MAG: hypothetical protein JWO12_3111 [Frankiales bacterium]|nr:hypothetical protein [Frankiales bacterium]
MILGAAAVVALLLVLLELRLRSASLWLAETPYWHDLLTERKVRQMRRLGHVDTVFVGASTVHFGIDPLVVDATVGGSHVSYNAALNRCLPIMVERWLSDVVLDALTPRTVVLGMCHIELNDNEVFGANRLQDYLGSRTFRMRPLDRVLRACSGAELVRYLPRFLHEPRRAAAALFRRKGPLVRLRADTRIEGQLGERGIGTEVQGRSYRNGPKLLEVLARDVCCDFSTGAYQFEAISRIRATCEARGVQLVLLATPCVEHDVASLITSGVTFDDLRRCFGRIAERESIPLLDLTQSVTDVEYFADLVHVNGAGRVALSEHVGRALSPYLDPDIRTHPIVERELPDAAS